jgi:hypothetical protein
MSIGLGSVCWGVSGTSGGSGPGTRRPNPGPPKNRSALIDDSREPMSTSTYLWKTEDLQRPIALMAVAGRPTRPAVVAPPRLKLCPAYMSAGRLQERRACRRRFKNTLFDRGYLCKQILLCWLPQCRLNTRPTLLHATSATRTGDM